MQRSNHTEVPAVRRENFADTKPLGSCHHGRAHKTEWQIGVVMEQRSCAYDVFGFERLDDEITVGHGTDERLLRGGAYARLKQVAHFREDGYRNNHVPRLLQPPRYHPTMPGITLVYQRIERPGISNHRHV